jgi:D-amino-acid dehydrogenase
VIEY